MQDQMEKRLADALKSIYRKLDLYQDELLQLSPKELAFLLIVEELGECRVKDLAGRVTLPLSTVSWTADRMVKNGLLSRDADPTDRRAIILSLTDQGRAALARHRQIFDGLAKAAVERLDPVETAQFVAIITKFADLFE